MSSNTRWTVLKRICEDYSVGWVAVNDGTQSGITTFSDDSVFGGRGRNSVPVGADVRIRQNSVTGDTGTNTYGEARVSAVASFSAGQLTFDPGPTAAAVPENPVVANNYTEALVLKDPDMRFEDACNYMNRALASLGWEKYQVPLTLVTDGDMISASTSSWTEVGSGALSKVAATFPLGVRVLRMTGVAANDYILSATIPVEPETSYYLEACGMIASTGAAADTGTLVLYDETNSASITLSEYTVNTFEPIVLRNSISTPAGCKQVSIRMEADNAGDVIDWAWVIFRKNSSRQFTVQDRPVKTLWLGELRDVSGDWGNRPWTDMPQLAAKPMQVGAGIWQYQVQQGCSGRSIWYEEFVQPAPMTADSSTTSVEVEDLAAVTAELWLRPKRKDPKWAEVYERAAYDRVEALQRRLSEVQGLRQNAQFVLSPLRV